MAIGGPGDDLARVFAANKHSCDRDSIELRERHPVQAVLGDPHDVRLTRHQGEAENVKTPSKYAQGFF
jgi:hypothetical protein